MTQQIQAAAKQPAQKVYSNDKKIYIGMTVKDASKSTEIMKIFDFADVDKNGEIDKEELDRYNGPVIVQNVETKEARVIGQFASILGRGVFKGDIFKDNEIVYYPGLTIEKTDDKGRVSFTQIDTNHDGKLSEKEITAVAKELKQLENTKQNMKEAYTKARKAGKIGAGTALGTSVTAGIAGGVIAGEAFAGIVTGGLSIIVTGAAWLGYLAYRNSNLQDELNELKTQFFNNVKNPYVKERATEEFAKTDYSVF